MKRDGLLLAALAAMASCFHAADASACGGCFHPEEQTPEQASVVTAHRMALAVSTTRTVLWDQVQYTGSPAEFAWVLPVKPGARVEVASDAWFETLDAATAVRVNAPALACDDGAGMGCAPGMAAGCGADEGMSADLAGAVVADPVTVVHRGSAGPYETVTLHSDVPGALTGWLQENGFAIDADVQPIIDGYTADGFDFIALRLLPDIGVQQMKPVRIIQPGAVTTLPLRMVAAGTGANVALTLFVLGEGRWATDNFPAVEVDLGQLSWDFSFEQSNYTSLRDAALASNDGRSWLTSYAQKGSLLGSVMNPVTRAPAEYSVNGQITRTISEAFVLQGLLNQETADGGCLSAIRSHAASGDVVVDPCDEDGACRYLVEGEIDARDFACGELDDLGVALTGMHPRDVWVTRLEANLPREALADDLELLPAGGQQPVQNWILADTATNAPCPVAGAPPRLGPSSRRPSPGAAFVLIAGALGLSLALRRLGRPAPAKAG